MTSTNTQTHPGAGEQDQSLASSTGNMINNLNDALDKLSHLSFSEADPTGSRARLLSGRKAFCLTRTSKHVIPDHTLIAGAVQERKNIEAVVPSVFTPLSELGAMNTEVVNVAPRLAGGAAAAGAAPLSQATFFDDLFCNFRTYNTFWGLVENSAQDPIYSRIKENLEKKTSAQATNYMTARENAAYFDGYRFDTVDFVVKAAMSEPIYGINNTIPLLSLTQLYSVIETFTSYDSDTSFLDWATLNSSVLRASFNADAASTSANISRGFRTRQVNNAAVAANLIVNMPAGVAQIADCIPRLTTRDRDIDNNNAFAAAPVYEFPVGNFGGNAPGVEEDRTPDISRVAHDDEEVAAFLATDALLDRDQLGSVGIPSTRPSAADGFRPPIFPSCIFATNANKDPSGILRNGYKTIVVPLWAFDSYWGPDSAGVALYLAAFLPPFLTPFCRQNLSIRQTTAGGNNRWQHPATFLFNGSAARFRWSDWFDMRVILPANSAGGKTNPLIEAQPYLPRWGPIPVDSTVPAANAAAGPAQSVPSAQILLLGQDNPAGGNPIDWAGASIPVINYIMSHIPNFTLARVSSMISRLRAVDDKLTDAMSVLAGVTVDFPPCQAVSTTNNANYGTLATFNNPVCCGKEAIGVQVGLRADVSQVYGAGAVAPSAYALSYGAMDLRSTMVDMSCRFRGLAMAGDTHSELLLPGFDATALSLYLAGWVMASPAKETASGISLSAAISSRGIVPTLAALATVELSRTLKVVEDANLPTWGFNLSSPGSTGILCTHLSEDLDIIEFSARSNARRTKSSLIPSMLGSGLGMECYAGRLDDSSSFKTALSNIFMFQARVVRPALAAGAGVLGHPAFTNNLPHLPLSDLYDGVEVYGIRGISCPISLYYSTNAYNMTMKTLPGVTSFQVGPVAMKELIGRSVEPIRGRKVPLTIPVDSSERLMAIQPANGDLVPAVVRMTDEDKLYATQESDVSANWDDQLAELWSSLFDMQFQRGTVPLPAITGNVRARNTEIGLFSKTDTTMADSANVFEVGTPIVIAAVNHWPADLEPTVGLRGIDLANPMTAAQYNSAASFSMEEAGLGFLFSEDHCWSIQAGGAVARNAGLGSGHFRIPSCNHLSLKMFFPRLSYNAAATIRSTMLTSVVNTGALSYVTSRDVVPVRMSAPYIKSIGFSRLTTKKVVSEVVGKEGPEPTTIKSEVGSKVSAIIIKDLPTITPINAVETISGAVPGSGGEDE